MGILTARYKHIFNLMTWENSQVIKIKLKKNIYVYMQNELNHSKTIQVFGIEKRTRCKRTEVGRPALQRWFLLLFVCGSDLSDRQVPASSLFTCALVVSLQTNT